MQISLFHPEDLPTVRSKSDGAKLRQSLLREHQYQKSRKEIAQLRAEMDKRSGETRRGRNYAKKQ